MSPAEAALYAAESAKPGAAVELALGVGEALALSSHCALHLNDDDEAVTVATSPGSRLYATLRRITFGAEAVAPLQVKLPPDAALVVLRPPSAQPLAIVQEGLKRIAFRFEGVTPARPRASAHLNALSFLASNQRIAAS